MKRIFTFLSALLVMSALSVKADMFTPTPQPLQESSKNVVITFDATQSGVAGLQGLSTDLYAHIGVYTTSSPNTWAYTSKWGDNAAKYKLARVGTDKYQITIGDIRTYFGITNANEKVTKICIIARTSDAKVQTSDQFVDVYPDGLYISLTSNPANTTITKATEITFTASTTQTANLKLYVDNAEVKSATNATSLTYTRNFNTPGVQNVVKAVATNSNGSVESIVNVFYVKASEQGNYPGGVPKQGAVKNADGSVTFCLAAPNKSSVILVGSWDNYEALSNNTMKYQDYNGFRYFWTTVTGLDNSTYYPYYYLVDGKYRVSDPYSSVILDYNSDKWLDGDVGADVFAECPDYPYSQLDGVMLGVYKGDMHDTYKWKVNNFKVTKPNSLVIYEMLFRDFTGESQKADGTIRKAIEKIDYLYDLGVTAVELMPVMEFDGNNSWGYSTNAYMALDKAYGSPDDLKEFIDLCHQKGIAVILDIVFNHTPGLHPWYQMYEAGASPFYNAVAPHDYSVYEDIKQEYPLVEQHWVDVLTFWLTTYKVDGFRFDLVKGLGDSNSYGNGTEAYNQTRINRMTRLHAAMKKVNPNVIHINEHLAGAEEETPMGNDGQYQWNNQNGNAITYASGGNADLRYFNSKNCSRPVCSTVDYAQSHDEQWVGNKAVSGTSTRMRRLGSVAAQLLMSPGPKMMFQFDELGYDKELTEANRVDPKYVPAASWYSSQYRMGLKQSYSDLNWMRRLNPEMFDADVTPVYTGFSAQNQGVRSIRLTKGNKEIIAFINPMSSQNTVSAPATLLNASNAILISASQGYTGTLSGSGTVSTTLLGHSYAVYATNNIAGVDNIIADENGENNFKVYGVEGEIIIEGEYENVVVYNMAGVMMPSLKVAAGLYIVNVDGYATKVLVK